jgi:hypothetical protein
MNQLKDGHEPKSTCRLTPVLCVLWTRQTRNDAHRPFGCWSEHFHCPEPPAHLLQPLIYFLPIALPCPEGSIVEVMQSVAFSDWLHSPSNTHFSLFQVFLWLIALSFDVFVYSAQHCYQICHLQCFLTIRACLLVFLTFYFFKKDTSF